MPIAVQRAENHYVPPYPTPTDAWAEVPGAELVYAWMEARTGRRIKRPDELLADEPAIWARVNQNRWVADCVCGSASVISLADPRWGCTECGYGWVTLVVPSLEEASAVEAELLKIPRPHLRNWWQAEDPHPMNPYRPVPEEPVPEEPVPEEPVPGGLGEDLPTVTP